jgi:beta-1,4-mannosyltransferase
MTPRHCHRVIPSTEAPSRLRVVTMPFPDGGSTDAFVPQLVKHLPADIDVRRFRWRLAVLGQYEVLHVHWPEYLIRDTKWGTRLAKRAMFLALAFRVVVTRTPVVWTVHNAQPHERGNYAERWLLGVWNRIVSKRVFLYRELLPHPASERDVAILDGGFAVTELDTQSPDSGKELLLQFGIVRPYKGTERLISAFTLLQEPNLRLRVVGQAISDAYAATIASKANDHRISLRLVHLTDEDLRDEIAACTCVVLPYHRMYNSGAALLSLALGRPVIAPESASMRALAAEVGEGWVITYRGELDEERLSIAITQLSGTRAEMPDLSARSWTTASQSYADLYRELARGPKIEAETHTRVVNEPAEERE